MPSNEIDSVSSQERAMIVPSREQLIYWLHEAAEIEHNLMCCYLYAAFSLKRGDGRWTPTQSQAVDRWRRQIVSVALEEMTHLCLVSNLMNALGATPHFNRPMFPIEAGPYPADFVIRLQPFSRSTIEHFKFLERPLEAHLSDAQGFTPSKTYSRSSSPDRLSPGARDYATVGELYAILRVGLDAFARTCGEARLFIGEPALQVDGSLAPLPGVCSVASLADAHHALDTIITQGEGAGAERGDSHFSRFSRICEELNQFMAEDPGFEPAWSAATNPVMNPPLTPFDKVHISHPDNARWLDIGNALYTTSLRCLLQGFAAEKRSDKAQWLAVSFALMRAVTPVGQGLAARPATLADGGSNAGLTFTSLRTLAVLPQHSAKAFVATRIDELIARAQAMPQRLVEGESASTWEGVIAALQAQRAVIGEGIVSLGASAMLAPITLATATATSTAAASMTSASSARDPTPVAAPIEIAKGRDLTIFFEARRCIHSRHCVLEAPTVFKANTPGEWIYPDNLDTDRLIEVAHKCPSGAIRYQRHDDGSAEQSPPVNVLNIRENGPYAVRAPIKLAGHDDGFRATLCRCGQSQRKPWCDGSHVSAKFQASGEPLTGNVEALASRDGDLKINPLHNGPLQVSGNLEICSGTGRTVAKITDARLCRCGQSKNKPFCDLSHVGAGFVADGA